MRDTIKDRKKEESYIVKIMRKAKEEMKEGKKMREKKQACML